MFWAIVNDGKTEREAHEVLKGTVSSEKHEILFSQFNINYDHIPEFFRKGTTLVWAEIPQPIGQPARSKPRKELRTLHVDIIGDGFWTHSGSVDVHMDNSLPYWQQPARLMGKGLGARVL